MEVKALAGQKVGGRFRNKLDKNECFMRILLVKEGEYFVGVRNGNTGVLNSGRNKFLKAIYFDLLLEAGGIDHFQSKVSLIQKLIAIFFISPCTCKLNIIGQLNFSEGQELVLVIEAEYSYRVVSEGEVDKIGERNNSRPVFGLRQDVFIDNSWLQFGALKFKR